MDEISRAGVRTCNTHPGGSVEPAVMWMIAHDRGIALRIKDYWDFVGLVKRAAGSTIAPAVAAPA